MSEPSECSAGGTEVVHSLAVPTAGTYRFEVSIDLGVQIRDAAFASESAGLTSLLRTLTGGGTVNSIVDGVFSCGGFTLSVSP